MKVAKIEEHLTDNDLNDLIKEHKDSYNILNEKIKKSCHGHLSFGS